MTEVLNSDVLVVGAGHAGGHVAITLRQKGFGGSILVVGNEVTPPYERPPLSKAYLIGMVQVERLLLREQDFWPEQGIDFELGISIIDLDGAARKATLADGRTIGYRWCVLATGGRARRLVCPGATLPGVHYLRTVTDVDAIRAGLRVPTRIVIVGAGYIGLEVAAAAREMGHQVTIVEAQSRVLARVTSPVVSHFYEQRHRAHGVDLRLNSCVAGIEGDDHVTGVRLGTGDRLPADMVIIGIGIDPDCALAEAAGADCDAGVLVDASCRTSVPGLLAVGDCARHPNHYAGGLWRLESVQHAVDSAGIAADTILGQPRAYQELPWFWSDQYDLKLQTAGLAKDADEIIVRGDPLNAPFTVVYLRQGRIIAVDAVNSPKDFMAARALIRSGAQPNRVKLADAAVPLKATL